MSGGVEEYFADIALAYQQEIKELYDAGCRMYPSTANRNGSDVDIVGNIQFDDPLLAYFCAESMIKGMEERGIDHEAILDLYIKVYNDCLKDHPADMTVGLHLCRGNFKVRIILLSICCSLISARRMACTSAKAVTIVLPSNSSVISTSTAITWSTIRSAREPLNH